MHEIEQIEDDSQLHKELASADKLVYELTTRRGIVRKREDERKTRVHLTERLNTAERVQY